MNFVFLDADVALSKDCLQRAVAQQKIVGRSAERLSSSASCHAWRAVADPADPSDSVVFSSVCSDALDTNGGTAAGCGQFFLTTKQAYQRSGGHNSIRQSLHDGIMLPRAYRIAGLKTDLFDASDIASCRMYTSFEEKPG